jgi:hypothetical protein
VTRKLRNSIGLFARMAPGRLAWDTLREACLLLYTGPRGGRGAIIRATNQKTLFLFSRPSAPNAPVVASMESVRPGSQERIVGDELCLSSLTRSALDCVIVSPYDADNRRLQVGGAPDFAHAAFRQAWRCFGSGRWTIVGSSARDRECKNGETGSCAPKRGRELSD